MTHRTTTRLAVASSWDGIRLPRSEHAFVELSWHDDALEVRTDAPYYADPVPPGAPGATDRLWEHEVVELFLLAEPDRYLEIELGPHGHHLLLALEGVRRIRRSHLPVAYTVRRSADRWEGRAVVAVEHVPADVSRVNAYAIHGVGRRRRYHACYPVPGDAPDFHRLDCFGPLPGSGPPPSLRAPPERGSEE